MTTKRMPILPSAAIRGMKIAVDRRWTSEGTDETASKAFNEGLRVAAELGANICEIKFPDAQAVINDWMPLCGIQAAVCPA